MITNFTGSEYTQMRLLDHSAEATPLLVKLHDSHKMYQLAKDPMPESRGELAGIMSDLLSVDLKAHETELLTDVLMSLIAQAEIDLRHAIAERLAVMDNVPLRLIINLANDDIKVADPILRESRMLHDMDLMYIVKSQGVEYWRAIASRSKLSGVVVDTLAETRDIGTAINLVQNSNVLLTPKALEALGDMAKSSSKLAQKFIVRDEVTKEIAMKLYQFVADDIKSYIKDNYVTAIEDVADEAVNEVIEEFRSSMNGDHMPTSEMVAMAVELKRRETLNVEVMIENLRRGQVANFIAIFATYCDLPMKTTLEMMRQETGQGLAVACKARRIEKTDFVNMYLLTARVRSGKIITQSLLSKALSYYDNIKGSDARVILDQSQKK